VESESSDHPSAPGPADAYSPAEIARRVETLGVAKARTGTFSLLVLAILAGAFISIGALLYVFAITDPKLGFGPTRLLGGAAFSLGLILVVIAGAELFTGNNLIAMAYASGRIGPFDVLRNWCVVYAGNVIGCLATVGIVLACDLASAHGGEVEETVRRIAHAKMELSGTAAFARGVLCNALVCLAVWLAMGGRTVTDKVLAIVFPITAFVAIGLEHSIANWFFLPYGLAFVEGPNVFVDSALNLVAVTAGNIVGGTVLVGGIYWLAYRRGSPGSGRDPNRVERTSAR